jgi:asparagine N-glycosylation enzyme membrane subunit Stt3
VTIGVAIALAAVGAILRYAVEDRISGIDLPTVGLILIIAGVVGFLAGLAMAMGGRDRETVVRERRDPYY